MQKLTSTLTGELRILAKFSAVGVLATLLHLAISLNLVHFVGVPAQRANLIAFGFALVVSFVGNYFWTFRSSRSYFASIVRFAAVSGTGYFASAAIIATLARLSSLPPEVQLIAAAAAFPVISYIASRLWIY